MNQQFYHLFRWDNCKENSPHPQTRNSWLFRYGAFAQYQGRWFPAKVMRLSMIGEPATIRAVPEANVNLDLYPHGEIPADQCQVIYTVFSDGTPIGAYVSRALSRLALTDRMLDAGIARSLNTEIIGAPKRLMREIKKALNVSNKREVYVLATNNPDEISKIELPRTIEVVERLWDSRDWAEQEIAQLLGITFNPESGKRERLVRGELMGNRDIVMMNREMIISRLRTTAERFGESVEHIGNIVDISDRGLTGAKEDKDDGNGDIS